MELNRRDLLGAGVLTAAAAAGIWAAVREGDSLGADAAPTPRQQLMARQVAQIVIPRTDTPGAADVGAHEFLIVALAHGLDGTRAPVGSAAIQGSGPRRLRGDGTLNYLDWLERELDRRARGDFMRVPLARQQATVQAIDAEAFAEGADESPWKKIKNLLLTGYYTSEVGGSQELRYELTPGRWDPDLPFGPSERAWSSDWTAVEFG